MEIVIKRLEATNCPATIVEARRSTMTEAMLLDNLRGLLMSKASADDIRNAYEGI